MVEGDCLAGSALQFCPIVPELEDTAAEALVRASWLFRDLSSRDFWGRWAEEIADSPTSTSSKSDHIELDDPLIGSVLGSFVGPVSGSVFGPFVGHRVIDLVTPLRATKSHKRFNEGE